MDLSQVRIETFRGKGPGGQHKNKTDSCVKATHIPTGVSVTIDGRSQGQNKRRALKELRGRLEALRDKAHQTQKKRYRNQKIKTHKVLRTYDFKRQEVKNHGTGKKHRLRPFLNGDWS